MVGASSTAEVVDDALAAIAEEIGASLVVLYRVGRDGIEGTSPRGMDNPMGLYAARYFESCPLQDLKRRYNPEVAIVTDMLSRSAVRRSEVFNEFYRAHRIERHLSVRLSSIEHGVPGCCGIVWCRSDSDRPWRAKDVEEMKRLRPLIASALDRSEQLDALRSAARERDVLAAIVSVGVRAPRLVFDASARLVWASPSAVQILDHARGGPGLEEAFRDAVRALLLQSQREPAPAAAMTSASGVGSPPVRASLLLVRTTPSAEPLVLVRIGDGDERDSVPARADGFGLSRAEASVLEVLRLGKNNREIARHLCVSVDTVRTHLKQIYAKMGVHSRLEAIVKARDVRSS